MKICNVCKTVLDDSASYCPRCKSQTFSPFQTKRCPFCNNTVAVGTIVCPNCHKILPPEEIPSQNFSQNYGQAPVAPNFNNQPNVQNYNNGGQLNGQVERQSGDNQFEKVNFDQNSDYNGQGQNAFPVSNQNAYPNQNANQNAPNQKGYKAEGGNRYVPINPNGYYNFGDSPNGEQTLGYEQSSAKLNDKINSKIAQNGEQEKHHGKRHENKNVIANEEIVRKAYSEMDARSSYGNENGSPTYIYNQIYPNQQGTVVGETMRGAPNISSVGNTRAKREGAGHKIAVLLSMLFLIGGIAVALLLDGLHFYYDNISGLQLATAGLPSAISGYFPSRFWEYSRNGFIVGADLAIYKALPALCLASILTAFGAVVAHLFCFKPTTVKKVFMLILSAITFVLVAITIVFMIVIFNYATVGIGQYVFAGTTLLSLLTIVTGYRVER